MLPSDQQHSYKFQHQSRPSNNSILHDGQTFQSSESMASWREGWCGSVVTVDIILRWGRRDRETPLGTYSDVLSLEAWNGRLSPIGLR